MVAEAAIADCDDQAAHVATLLPELEHVSVEKKRGGRESAHCLVQPNRFAPYDPVDLTSGPWAF
jgi:hypothetical protein